MKKIILVISVILISLSFAFSQKTTKIKGRIINDTSELSKIYLYDILNKTNIAESPINKKGKYKLKAKIKETGFYQLKLGKSYNILYIPTEGEKAKINIDLSDIKHPAIKKSKHTKLYYDNIIDDKLSSKERTAWVKKFINDNPSSPVCLFYIDALDISKDFTYYEKLANGLSKYKSVDYINSFVTRVANEKRLASGLAPEIALASPNGEIIKLSSLKGKYVLIDFWASWCRPCRAESPNMVKVYNKYHDKGFEIYSVSLDRNKDAWLKAIQDDKLGKWTHVSDLKFWQSEGAKLYNVRSIPYTVLLDKNGKIIAKGLRGKQLDNKLEEIFSK